MQRVVLLVTVLMGAVLLMPGALADDDWPPLPVDPLGPSTQQEQGTAVDELLAGLVEQLGQEASWVQHNVPLQDDNGPSGDDVAKLANEISKRLQGSNDCVEPWVRLYPTADLTEPSLQIAEEAMEGTIDVAFNNGVLVVYATLNVYCLGEPDASSQSTGG